MAEPQHTDLQPTSTAMSPPHRLRRHLRQRVEVEQRLVAPERLERAVRLQQPVGADRVIIASVGFANR
jgi:hypothetical protein